MRFIIVLLLCLFAFSCKKDDFVIPVPEIQSFTPASAHVGDIVRISGKGLEYTQSVKIGSQAAFFQLKSGTIEAVIPAGAVKGVVSVASSTGASQSKDTITILPADKGPQPVITSINPMQAEAGNKIDITGTNLQKVTSVFFNGTPAFFLLNGTVLEVIVPENASSGKIKIITINGEVESAESFMVLETKEPPQIQSVTPSENPVDWPILIEGDHMDSITKITFDGIEAPIDTNFAGTVTTRVPLGVVPGTVELKLTSSNGASNSYLYNVLAKRPGRTQDPPRRWFFKEKARYPIKVQNNWSNEFGAGNIFLSENLNGTETIDGIDYTIENVSPNNATKVITLNIIRSYDQFGDPMEYETYTGTYVDSDVPNQDEPARQRIIFVNEKGRQIVVTASTPKDPG